MLFFLFEDFAQIVDEEQEKEDEQEGDHDFGEEITEYTLYLLDIIHQIMFQKVDKVASIKSSPT